MAKKQKPGTPKMGRPSKYSPEIAARICEAISTSTKGLHSICQAADLPGVTTVMMWLRDHEDFRKQYAHAREAQADFLGGQILDIADDGSNDLMTIEKGDSSYEMENKEVTNRSKLRVDARKWLMSKLAPKKYGDKIEVSGDAANPLTVKITGMEIK